LKYQPSAVLAGVADAPWYPNTPSSNDHLRILRNLRIRIFPRPREPRIMEELREKFEHIKSRQASLEGYL
jgi:hypothetical protein